MLIIHLLIYFCIDPFFNKSVTSYDKFGRSELYYNVSRELKLQDNTTGQLKSTVRSLTKILKKIRL